MDAYGCWHDDTRWYKFSPECLWGVWLQSFYEIQDSQPMISEVTYHRTFSWTRIYAVYITTQWHWTKILQVAKLSGMSCTSWRSVLTLGESDKGEWNASKTFQPCFRGCFNNKCIWYMSFLNVWFHDRIGVQPWLASYPVSCRKTAILKVLFLLVSNSAYWVPPSWWMAGPIEVPSTSHAGFLNRKRRTLHGTHWGRFTDGKMGPVFPSSCNFWSTLKGGDVFFFSLGEGGAGDVVEFLFVFTWVYHFFDFWFWWFYIHFLLCIWQHLDACLVNGIHRTE